MPTTTTPRLVKARTTRTSLVLPEDLGIDTWRALGEEILAVSESSVWWLGDWLVFGERKYPDRYKRAMRHTSLDYQTLRNYAWAARRFPPARRRAKLSLQHHIEVAALPQPDQDHWLDFAERMRWPRDELRRQVRASATQDTDGVPTAASLKLTFRSDQVRRWSAAADSAGIDLTEWITSVLNAAVCDNAGKPATRVSVRRRSA
nr:LmbU family transcriptional regulator [Kibdelosporangium sp. MJ126-NF4]CEL13018.1 conserved hypothetical protein present in several antibiotic biosynthetic clusters [Kibdelosporangium sp. MJ126-NF4]CTQ98704.1 conserved hypothetical protein present in several antibiotic biosynthetic clusters [Kibdelosporangium sp. MJ126-NF4]